MCQWFMHVCMDTHVCTNKHACTNTRTLAAAVVHTDVRVPTELRSTGTAHHFAFLLNTSDYRILRMDEDHDRMYIGSKDHILSLDLHDINKDPHIVRSPPAPIPNLS